VLDGRLLVLVADGELDPGTYRVSGRRQIVVLSWDAGKETLVEEARHDVEPALDALAI
jgi:hypothetical protein